MYLLPDITAARGHKFMTVSFCCCHVYNTKLGLWRKFRIAKSLNVSIYERKMTLFLGNFSLSAQKHPL
jgi:hypothetical protein